MLGRSRVAFGLSVLLASGCAHAPQPGTLETLKPAADTFFKRVRWRDYRGAGELIVPERRSAFVKARQAANDERDLEITDYETEDMKLGADGKRAVVVCRISWTRLPSVSVETKTVTSLFVWRDNTWWLAQQDAGPFSAELEKAYEEPPKAPAH